MKYSKLSFYNDFKCLANQCPDTCCAWSIDIDEESLERYSKEQGEFGERLKRSIDWEDETFILHNNRCSFLNEDNMCDMYKELGKGALCETFPRHINKYDGVRELSLLLSCPIVAERIIGEENPLAFIDTEDEVEENLTDDDFNDLFFTQIHDVRAVMIDILQNRYISIDTRMSMLLSMAQELDICIKKERHFDIDGVIQKWRTLDTQVKGEYHRDHKWNLKNRYNRMSKLFSTFYSFDQFDDKWINTIEYTNATLYDKNKRKYNKIYESFHNAYGYNSSNAWKWETISENIMVIMIYNYLCEDLYNEKVYSKIGMAVFTTMCIQDLIMARWVKKDGKITIEDCVELAYRCVRQIEHSIYNFFRIDHMFENPKKNKL